MRIQTAMADDGNASRYVKLDKEQEAVEEEITPGELNQPVAVAEVSALFPPLSFCLKSDPSLAPFLVAFDAYTHRA